ncbi:DUF1795 domain-containing protein [Alkalihalobacillus oceani]|uniref:DUF1795 domain-containing protein n=1 Tax=Halalkalibacter oceani TaxID=1653776 RepID=A0A9X2IPR8_9BACI|nr:PsbP-related protein [Halalkalibacter oceani]MCM3715116.1 DUF1795 domain-containing protein [Halalkalibacter oceani]
MRKKMKTWLVAVLSFHLILLLAACGEEVDSSTEEEAPSEVESSDEDTAEEEAGEETAGAEGVQTYTNDQFAFSVEYPGDWTLQEVNETMLGFVSSRESEDDPFMENVSVQLNHLDGQSLSLEELTEILLANVQNEVPDFELTSSETVEATDEAQPDVHYLEYTGTQGDLQLAYEALLFINNDRAFVFTYTAEMNNFNQYYEAYTQIIESLTF